jgi:homoserine O-acetyltransferase
MAESQSNNEYSLYDLGDFALNSGGTLSSAQIAFKIFGNPKNPAIVYPTWYSGSQPPFPLIPLRRS